MALYRDLNMDLTPEQIAIKEETHKFAKEELRPASIELDKINDPKEKTGRASCRERVLRLV